MAKVWRGCALLALAAFLAGCRSAKDGVFPGDLSRINRGMNVSQVEERIGPPLYMNEGEDERTGRNTWVYRTGYLLIYRQTVVAVVPVANERDLPPHQRPRDTVGSTIGLDPFTKDDQFYHQARTKSGVGAARAGWDDAIYKSY